jgi:predicted TIM-barrel fold metal-dependent hydrolase
MPKKQILTFLVVLFAMVHSIAYGQRPDSLLLKNYRPRSIFKVPVTQIKKAKFPVIDMHSHPFGATDEAIANWVKMMDKYGIEKTIILTQASGARFDSIYTLYSKYGDRFDIWCAFDYTGYNEPGWSEAGVKELERCFKAGAKGVGELGDKGLGEIYSQPTPGLGMHIDDPRMRPLLKRCGELKMPVNIHVAESKWMYEPMDSTNDGLMNAYEWKVDMTKPGILAHSELIGTLENAVRQNPNTIFIAAHFANCDYDLSILGNLLDKFPNLYADISARYAETAPIPLYMRSFYKRYQNRLLFGTDMENETRMYETVFRLLQTSDEHFYAIELTGYHWPMYGFGLDDAILKKIYRTNALKILNRLKN